MNGQPPQTPLPTGLVDQYKSSTKSGELKTQKVFQDILYFVVTVLFVGYIALLVVVIGMVVETWNRKESNYDKVGDKLTEQNLMIDALIKNIANQDEKIGSLIDELTQYRPGQTPTPTQ